MGFWSVIWCSRPGSSLESLKKHLLQSGSCPCLNLLHVVDNDSLPERKSDMSSSANLVSGLWGCALRCCWVLQIFFSERFKKVLLSDWCGPLHWRLPVVFHSLKVKLFWTEPLKTQCRTRDLTKAVNGIQRRILLSSDTLLRTLRIQNAPLSVVMR